MVASIKNSKLNDKHQIAEYHKNQKICVISEICERQNQRNQRNNQRNPRETDYETSLKWDSDLNSLNRRLRQEVKNLLAQKGVLKYQARNFNSNRQFNK